MSQKTIKGSQKLGESIRSRRLELGLTIEEAAAKAGVGIKSWCRYESGESIRSDKAKGICKVLNWHKFPTEDSTSTNVFNIDEFKAHDAWSSFLSKEFGEIAAISFATGSDILLDSIEEDLAALSSLPQGSHIGQLPLSATKDNLPEQFLMKYDYDFLYQFKTTVMNLRKIAKSGRCFLAHNVLEELAIYLCMEESSFLLECISEEMELSGIEDMDMLNCWAFDLFDDMDIVTFLFSGIYLNKEDSYHFDNWTKDQFYTQD